MVLSYAPIHSITDLKAGPDIKITETVKRPLIGDYKVKSFERDGAESQTDFTIRDYLCHTFLVVYSQFLVGLDPLYLC